MKVINTKDNFEQCIRKFKKKVAESGVLQELRDRECYVKPSIERKISRGKARNRWRKYLASQALPKKLF
jgi:small subunit ribosomal protein S21